MIAIPDWCAKPEPPKPKPREWTIGECHEGMTTVVSPDGEAVRIHSLGLGVRNPLHSRIADLVVAAMNAAEKQR